MLHFPNCETLTISLIIIIGTFYYSHFSAEDAEQLRDTVICQESLWKGQQEGSLHFCTPKSNDVSFTLYSLPVTAQSFYSLFIKNSESVSLLHSLSLLACFLSLNFHQMIFWAYPFTDIPFLWIIKAFHIVELSGSTWFSKFDKSWWHSSWTQRVPYSPDTTSFGVHCSSASVSFTGSSWSLFQMVGIPTGVCVLPASLQLFLPFHWV